MAVEATIETTTTTVKISKKNKTDKRRYRTDGGNIPSKHFVDSPIVTDQNIFDGPMDGHHKSPIVTDQWTCTHSRGRSHFSPVKMIKMFFLLIFIDVTTRPHDVKKKLSRWAQPRDRPQYSIHFGFGEEKKGTEQADESQAMTRSAERGRPNFYFLLPSPSRVVLLRLGGRFFNKSIWKYIKGGNY